MGFGDDVRSWTANGFFWSGNFSMVLGSALSSGGALVLQPTFSAEPALDLMESERVTLPFAWPHQWAKLEEAPNWSTVDLSSLHYVESGTPLARHPTVKTAWQYPPSYGNDRDASRSIRRSRPRRRRRSRAGSHGEPLPGNTLKIVDPAHGRAGAARRARRDRRQGPDPHAGLRRHPERRDARRRRVLPYRRRRLPRRGRAALLGGPPQRHHQDRRRQRLAQARSTSCSRRIPA